LARAASRFPHRYKTGQLDRLTAGKTAQGVRLADQYRAMQHGDVARRLDTHGHVNRAHAGHASGAYRHPVAHGHYHGRISPHYTSSCFHFNYHGHRHFAGSCWYPHWNPWVRWSWHYRCHALWDPRPFWCRPVIYTPVVHWTYYTPPVWVSLPTVASGTWVDVPQVVVANRFDLQLLAVRMVDPGHPDEKLGPRFRVWFRNNGDRPITDPFDVFLVAAGGGELRADSPRAGVRVTSIEAGDTQSVDVRLPLEAESAGRDAAGNPTPFSTLHVLVDANRQIDETTEANNGAQIDRSEILPVDPAAFEVEPLKGTAGGEIVLAGEGFGPRPGKLLVHVAGKEYEGEILGWYDLGVRATLPKLALAAPIDAELVVIRGDGAAANPLKITIAPMGPGS